MVKKKRNWKYKPSQQKEATVSSISKTCSKALQYHCTCFKNIPVSWELTKFNTNDNVQQNSKAVSNPWHHLWVKMVAKTSRSPPSEADAALV